MNVRKPLHFLFLICFLGSYTFSFGQAFNNVSAQSGVNDIHDGSGVLDMNFGSGGAWLDYNKDGFLDLYVTARTGANKLYKNNGDDTFTDVATSLNIADASGDGGGVSVADINNDGWDDIFLSNCQGNKLFINENGTNFLDITSTAFMDGTAGGVSKSPSASWGDYDGDGYLDLYIAQHAPPAYNQGMGTTQDFFFHNNGDSTFTDVSSLLVIDSLMSWAFIGGWTDFDKDGDMDIFLINDCDDTPGGQSTKIFRNDGGTDPLNWNFTEVAAAVGVDDCRNGMGIGVGDYNRDGWMDIFYTNIGDCVLFENNNGMFSDVSSSAGIDGQAASFFSWGAAFMDYDLDGWQDIFVSLGTLSDFTYLNPQPNQVFKNNGDNTFTETAFILGLADPRRTRSMLYGDYDNDGDLDLYLINYGEPCVLFRNENNNGNHYFKLKLEGTQSNRNGCGSKVKLTTPDGVIQYYETRSGSNLSGGDSPYAHFGLGNNTTITELEITWLSGEVQTINNLNADQLYVAIEPLAPLPVELSFFTARAEDEAVRLNWSTASETNNDYFIVQRSVDGIAFEDLEKVQGNGTTFQNSTYDFLDRNPFNGKNYYRLKQVDFDGKFSYSPVELVVFLEKETTVNVFPNPSKEGILNVHFYNQSKNTRVEVRDILGRLVFEKDIEDLGNQKLEISTERWDNGLYLVRLSDSFLEKQIKVVVNN